MVRMVNPSDKGWEVIAANYDRILQMAHFMAGKTEGIVDAYDLANHAAIAAREDFDRRYDPEKSSERAFVMLSARYRMLDYLRAGDHISRKDRQTRKAGGQAGFHVISLDERLREGNGYGDAQGIGWLDPNEPEPWEVGGGVFGLDTERVMRGLSDREKLIIRRYYIEEATMKSIGAELGISESRVSQMHSEILARLKKGLINAGVFPPDRSPTREANDSVGELASCVA
jgi:DNA-directed RNA polymerase specialized sigma24 family protein